MVQHRLQNDLETADFKDTFTGFLDQAGDAMWGWGTVVPVNGTAGWGIGAIFQQTDGIAQTSIYINEGTAASSTFQAIGSVSYVDTQILLAEKKLITIPFDSGSVDTWMFIADRAYTVDLIEEVHSVVGSDGSAVTLAVRKITDVSAPGAVAGATVKELLSGTTIDLKATADTILTPALTATSADLDLADGDKIGLNFGGTLTALAGGLLVVTLKLK